MFKFGLFATIVWLSIAVGWAINTVKAISGVIALAHLTDISGELILRVIGIFAFPFGAIMGLFVW